MTLIASRGRWHRTHGEDRHARQTAVVRDGGLGALLRAYRERALLTQEDLAERTGLSTRTIRRLESDRLGRPRMATIRALASQLDLSSAERTRLATAEPDRAPARDRASAPRPVGGPDELPATIPDFTGRSGPAATVTAALLGHGSTTTATARLGAPRVVGICGPPGVGKTCLAVRVGHLLREHFPDGRLYVDLHGLEDRPPPDTEALARLLRRVAGPDAALPDTLDERAALLRSRLAERRTLIVLDNAWTEAQVRHLLPGRGDSAVLLTSRRPLLALDGLVRIDLGVFRPDEAFELLGRIVGPDRIAADPAAAAKLVELCGFLPLAVRIAGARLAARPHWPVRKLARQLADERQRLDALAAGDRAVRCTIGLSYRALDPRQRRLFCLLGELTENEVPAWVAAALLDLPGPDAEELIEELVEARLAEASGGGGQPPARYGLHSLLRLFARERCRADEPAPERTRAARRMVGGWLHLAEQAQTRLPGGRSHIGGRGGLRWPVPTDVTAEAVANPEAWFETERLALAGAVRTACSFGLDELAWDLALCLGRFLEVRG